MKAEEEEQQRLAEARRAQQERERLAAAAAAERSERARVADLSRCFHITPIFIVWLADGFRSITFSAPCSQNCD